MIKYKKYYIFFILIFFSYKLIYANNNKTNFFNKIYPGGFRVILYKTNKYPSVSLNLFIKTGSINETKKLNGISHLSEHLFFTFSPLFYKIKTLGGKINAQTHRYYTQYYIQLPKEYIKIGIDFLIYSLTNPQISKKKFKSEKNIVYQEMHDKSLSIYYNILTKFDKLPFPDTPYSLEIGGNFENIEKLTLKDYLNYRKLYYNLNNCILVITGDFDIKKISKYINYVINHININTYTIANELFKIKKLPKKGVKKTYKIKTKNKYFLLIAIPVKGIINDEKSTYIFDLLSIFFQTNYSYFKQLKDKGIIENYYINYTTPAYVGFFQILIKGDIHKKDIIYNNILNYLKKLKLNKTQLKTSKELLKTTYNFSWTDYLFIGENLGFFALYKKFTYPLNYTNNLNKIKLKNLNNYIKKYFNDEKFFIINFIPKDYDKKN